MKGVVRRYLTEKRFGFILPEGGGSEVFFHLSVFNVGADGPPPITNEPVEYELGDGTRSIRVDRLATPQHRVGVVASYDPVKGYGFITVTGGQCYLHKSEVIGGAIPAVGARVDFYTMDTVPTGKSPRACYIAVLT